jgi:dCTP deaminase
MILGDKFIHNAIADGYIVNFEYDNVEPASIDIRLGHSFAKPVADQRVALGDPVKYEEFTVPDKAILWLEPGEFCLATTVEGFKIPKDQAAFVQGRSSIGRAGLTIQNAGFVEPGFRGHITLELKNESNHSIGLVPGYRVGQLVFFQTIGVSRVYKGKYNGQVEATGSRMHLDR